MAVDHGEKPLTRPPERVDKATHSEDGVDLTLIRGMLSLTPAERLQVLQHNIASIMGLQGTDCPRQR